MSGKIFRHEHRVTYAECTLGNHIYYARYLDILETARGEFFRALGIPLASLQEQDVTFPVIECQLKYKFPARYDDVLDVELWLDELDRIRLRFGYRIINQSDQLILEGTTSHVCTSTAEKPKRLPPQLTTSLLSYLRAEHSSAEIRSGRE
jgi:acyl-CoA thioester hydrolase